MVIPPTTHENVLSSPYPVAVNPASSSPSKHRIGIMFGDANEMVVPAVVERAPERHDVRFTC